MQETEHEKPVALLVADWISIHEHLPYSAEGRLLADRISSATVGIRSSVEVELGLIESEIEMAKEALWRNAVER